MSNYEYEIRLEKIQKSGDFWYVVYKRRSAWLLKNKWIYDKLFSTEKRAREHIDHEINPMKSTIIARFDKYGNEML